MNRNRFLIHLIAGACLFVGLAGTSPGNVGGCNVDTLSISCPEHCDRRERAACNREFLAGRRLDGTPCDLTTEVGMAECATDLAICVGMVDATCSACTFQPRSCSPTRSASDACINRLEAGPFDSPTADQIIASPVCMLCTP